MTFLEWLQSITTAVKPTVELLVSLGLATLLVAVVLRMADRARWRRFRRDADRWSRLVMVRIDRHPKEIEDDEFVVATERLMVIAGFTPKEVCEYSAVAVKILKGLITERLGV